MFEIMLAIVNFQTYQNRTSSSEWMMLRMRFSIWSNPSSRIASRFKICTFSNFYISFSFWRENFWFQDDNLRISLRLDSISNHIRTIFENPKSRLNSDLAGMVLGMLIDAHEFIMYDNRESTLQFINHLAKRFWHQLNNIISNYFLFYSISF